MAKFKTIPEIVDAVQFDGQDMEGLRINRPEIIYSLDKKFFYRTNCNARDWLSIEKNENGKYDAMPFAFYSVKSHPDREPATDDHALSKLYLEIFRLKDDGPYAFIDKKGSKDAQVNIGDWVITDHDGRIYRMNDKDFHSHFEEVK